LADADITDATNRPRVIALHVVVYSFGKMMGPVLGGLLARPASLYPATFAADGVWGDFPYLLPTLVVTAQALLGVVAVQAWLPADSRSWRDVLCPSRAARYRAVASDDDTETLSEKRGEGKPKGVGTIYRRILSAEATRLVIIAHVMCMSLNNLYQGYLPLFCKEEPTLGGLGWDALHIGYLLSTTGVMAMVRRRPPC
jgi:hypothetical protein